MRCGLCCFARRIESLIISSHVLGGFGTRSERYHSSCVLVLYGTAYNLPFHVAVSSGTFSVPLVACCLYLPVHGRIQPASANSASQVTSRPRMSMVLKRAARRLTSC